MLDVGSVGHAFCLQIVCAFAESLSHSVLVISEASAPGFYLQRSRLLVCSVTFFVFQPPADKADVLCRVEWGDRAVFVPVSTRS